MNVFHLTTVELQALQLSIRVALVAVVFSLPFGALMAWVLARKSFPGKIALDGLLHLPLVLPPVVTGYLLTSANGTARSGRKMAVRQSRVNLRV